MKWIKKWEAVSGVRWHEITESKAESYQENYNVIVWSQEELDFIKTYETGRYYITSEILKKNPDEEKSVESGRGKIDIVYHNVLYYEWYDNTTFRLSSDQDIKNKTHEVNLISKEGNIDITKKEDDWFLVNIYTSDYEKDYWYLVDELEGLKDFLQNFYIRI